MSFPRLSLVASLAVAVASTGLQVRTADGATIIGHTNDYEARVGIAAGNAGTFSIGQGTATELRVGASGTVASLLAISAIYLFPLPEPGIVTSASLSFEYIGQSSAGPAAGVNVDVYGMGYNTASSSNRLGTHHYAGPNDTSAGINIPQVQKIVDDILTPSTPSTISAGTPQIISTGDILPLRQFIQDLYDNGAQEGDWAFIRLSYDQVPENDAARRYVVAAADKTSGKPTLELTVAPIPEPASLALLGLGAIGLLARRRRMV